MRGRLFSGLGPFGKTMARAGWMMLGGSIVTGVDSSRWNEGFREASGERHDAWLEFSLSFGYTTVLRDGNI